MTPRSILIVTDFSASSDHALSRAALLGADHGATLELLYLAMPGEQTPPDAACRLAHHALQLGQRHGIEARTLNRVAFELQDVTDSASRADLVVWGAAPVTGVRAFFRAQPLEEVLRKSRRPVLVVRRAAEEAYRKLVVAVDFSQVSHRLVHFALAVNATAQVKLFHAISTAQEGKLRYAQISEKAIKAYREDCRRHARDRMLTLADSYDTRRNRLLAALGHGDPARQLLIQQQHTDADLIVVGKQPASKLSDWFFESVAQRVLRGARTDVLVVPHEFEPASGGAARRRLREAPGVRRMRAGAPLPPMAPDPAAMRARA